MGLGNRCLFEFKRRGENRLMICITPRIAPILARLHSSLGKNVINWKDHRKLIVFSSVTQQKAESEHWRFAAWPGYNPR